MTPSVVQKSRPPADPTPRQTIASAQVCVILATRGRPAILGSVVDSLKQQTLAPASVIVSCVTPEDAANVALSSGTTVVLGLAGLAAQRNAALRQVPPGTEIVVFFDDDFVPHARWIEAVVEAFARRPEVAAITGNVICDDIKGPGLSFEQASALLAGHEGERPDWVIEPFSPYGCNMAFRRSMIDGLAFDERLVLYGWLEDRDFGAMVARRGGHLIKIGAAMGVHMGAKSGRVSGRRLGYSQVINPLYLYAKGTMRAVDVLDHIARNVASNLVLSLAPEPHIDRAGRLRGNIAGLCDLVLGRLGPERAARL